MPEKRAGEAYAAIIESAEAYGARGERAAKGGVDAEIDLLRGMLAERVRDHPEDIASLAKLMPLLLRAMGLRYRISPQRAQDFAEQAAAVLKSLGEQFRAPDLD